MKYFLHDTNAFNDEKVTELFMKFGYEGVGLFYTILEKFANQEKPIKTNVIKAQLKIGKRLNKCWNFMEEIDLIQSVNGESFNKQLLNFSESYQIKKEKTRKKVAEWRKKQADAESVTDYVPVSNPPKVKESKVKGSKVIKKIVPKIDFNIPLEDRRKVFHGTIKNGIGKIITREDASDFYRHWAAVIQGTEIMKFETMETWSINLRIGTWIKNKKVFGIEAEAAKKDEIGREGIGTINKIIENLKQKL